MIALPGADVGTAGVVQAVAALMSRVMTSCAPWRASSASTPLITWT